MEKDDTSCLAENHCIDILNFNDGEVVHYSVVVVEGKLAPLCKCSAGRKVAVECIDGPWGAPSTTHHSLTRSQSFKCLLKLEHGNNKFIFYHGKAKLEFNLNFPTQHSHFIVLPVYIVCKGHDGRFQAPDHEDNSIDSACDRIDTGMRLIQSILADQLDEHGYGRRTFHLETDVDPKAPNCHVFYSETTVEQAHAADMNALWGMFGREIMQSPLGKQNHKFVAFLSCTHYQGKVFSQSPAAYDDIIKCTKGHVALGGGGLALFGTGCLHTWAASIEEVALRFSSVDPVNTALFMDDSNYRGTYGGCYSTTLGAVCHEIGHIFDLGHTTHGIMGPEYHNLKYLFLPEEIQFKSRSVLPDKNEIMLVSKEPIQSMELERELKVTWNKINLEQTSLFDPDTTASKTHSKQSKEDCSDQRNNSNKISCPEKSKGGSSTAESRENCNVKVQNYIKPAYDSLDLSYLWTQSCLGLLAYNKWINPDATLDETQTLQFDTTCNQIKSEYELRLVEIRDKNSKSILHWRFPETTGLTQFVIPRQCITPKARSLCIIDLVGNVLKVDLPDSKYPKSVAH